MDVKLTVDPSQPSFSCLCPPCVFFVFMSTHRAPRRHPHAPRAPVPGGPGGGGRPGEGAGTALRPPRRPGPLQRVEGVNPGAFPERFSLRVEGIPPPRGWAQLLTVAVLNPSTPIC